MADTEQPLAQIHQEECSTLTPTLADILSNDIILRFYQCVKDVKNQQSPKETSAMFFALCHALGDSVTFLKVPNTSKVMFQQSEQIFAVEVGGTQSQDALVQYLANTSVVAPLNSAVSILQPSVKATTTTTTGVTTPITPTTASAPAAVSPPITTNNTTLTNTISPTSSSSIQSSSDVGLPQTSVNNPSSLSSSSTSSSSPPPPPPPPSSTANTANTMNIITTVFATPTSTSTNSGVKRSKPEKEMITKRAKKPSPRDKLYSVRRNDMIQDLIKIPEADLIKLANSVDEEARLVIQGREQYTKFGTLTPIHRFAALANLLAHYDCEFAPRNAGVYYNYEYFQLYLAYRDLETERQQQQETHDLRPILVQCRAEIERVLEKTNWDTIRRRLTIGERICQMCGVIGRGFLLLSKQISGRKLLHNFNALEWSDFIRDFRKPENISLLKSLQSKYAPERFYHIKQPNDTDDQVIVIKDEPASPMSFNNSIQDDVLS